MSLSVLSTIHAPAAIKWHQARVFELHFALLENIVSDTVGLQPQSLLIRFQSDMVPTLCRYTPVVLAPLVQSAVPSSGRYGHVIEPPCLVALNQVLADELS